MNRRRPLERTAVRVLALGAFLLAGALTYAQQSEADRIEKCWLRVETRTGKIGKQKTNRQKGSLRLGSEELILERRRGRPIRIPVGEIDYISRGYLGVGGEVEWVVLTMSPSSQARTYAVRDGGKLGFGSRTRDIEATLRAHLQSIHAAQYEQIEGFQPYLGWVQKVSFQRPESWEPRSPKQEYSGTRITLAQTVLSDAAGQDQMWFDGRESPKGASCRGTRVSAQESFKSWLESEWWGPALRQVRLTAESLGPCESFKIEAESEWGPVIGKWISQGETSFVVLTRAEDSELAQQILRTIRVPAESNLR